MILVTHAYSRANQGDGLLVDETLSILRQAIPEDQEHVIGALHADSFVDLPAVVQIPGIANRLWATEAVNIAWDMFKVCLNGNMRYPLYDQFLGKVKLVVGVGGGYLRSGTCLEASKTAIAHLSQLLWAARHGIPTFYLPQSIGPLRGPVGYGIREALRKINCVCVRDDRSAKEVGKLASCMRLPDLAIFELFRTFAATGRPQQVPKVYLIARDLERPGGVHRGYIERLKALRKILPDCEPLIQSSTRGNDDTAFYRSLGWGDTYRTTRDVIAAKDYGVVISVRLHGALQAMLGGFPAVHLTYERKGFGAFQDLAIPGYVHLSTGFDPKQVAEQARSLQANSREYWRLIETNRERVGGQYEQLKGMIRDAYLKAA